MKNYYDSKAALEFTEALVKSGWEQKQIDDGCLLYGSWLLVSPDENHYHYLVRETYINEWSSAYTIRKCSKISKALELAISAYELEHEND